MENKYPDFIGIGTMKSGTTSLYGALTQHPKIASAKRKETRCLFNNFKGYSQYLANCKENQLIGEFTPSYICYKSIAKKLYNKLPNIKLIVLFRNPITRTSSMIWKRSCIQPFPFSILQAAI